MNPQLRKACVDGDAERVLELLTAGIPPDEPLDTIGTTPLMAAASVDVVDVLLDAGAAVHPTRFGHDALQVVVSDDESAIEDLAARLMAARRLLAHGAPLDRRNEHGWSRVYVATFAGDVGTVAALLELGADPDDEPPPLAAACWGSGEPSGAGAQIIDLLVSAGADVNRRDAEGWSLLHAAAMPYGHGDGFASSDGPNVTAIETLIRHGLAAGTKGPEGMTALMLVAADGDLGALEALLAAGCDPDDRDDTGHRAVDHAREAEQRLDEILITAPADTTSAVEAARDRVRLCGRRLSKR